VIDHKYSHRLTQADRDRIVQLYCEERIPQTEIARAMGVSQVTVSKVLRRYAQPRERDMAKEYIHLAGVERRDQEWRRGQEVWMAGMRHSAVSMWKRGRDVAGIAAILNVPRQTVRRLLYERYDANTFRQYENAFKVWVSCEPHRNAYRIHGTLKAAGQQLGICESAMSMRLSRSRAAAKTLEHLAPKVDRWF